jgi:hypothetical protein
VLALSSAGPTGCSQPAPAHITLRRGTEPTESMLLMGATAMLAGPTLDPAGKAKHPQHSPVSATADVATAAVHRARPPCAGPTSCSAAELQQLTSECCCCCSNVLCQPQQQLEASHGWRGRLGPAYIMAQQGMEQQSREQQGDAVLSTSGQSTLG